MYICDTVLMPFDNSQETCFNISYFSAVLLVEVSLLY